MEPKREVIPIDETTWRIQDDFVRYFLLAGTEAALLIDTGANSPDAKELAQTLTPLPLLLLNTHADDDHTSGDAAFSEVYMDEADYIGCDVAKKFPGCRLNPVHDGDCIDLGNRPLRIISIPGHTAGSVAVLDEKNRTLYAGDSVHSSHIFMFGTHRRPDLFAQALLKLEAMSDRFDRIYPCHGLEELPPTYIRRVYNVWLEVCSGKIPAEPFELRGQKLRSYTGDACGFYCDLPKE